MNDTPTTDARWEMLCCSGQSWYQIAEEMKLDCRQRERELTRVTEQRDRLAEVCDQYSEDEILCKLQEITEQRDRLLEAFKRHKRVQSDRANKTLQSLTPKP